MIRGIYRAVTKIIQINRPRLGRIQNEQVSQIGRQFKPAIIYNNKGPVNTEYKRKSETTEWNDKIKWMDKTYRGHVHGDECRQKQGDGSKWKIPSKLDR